MQVINLRQGRASGLLVLVSTDPLSMVEAAGCHNFRRCRQKTLKKAATSYFGTLFNCPCIDCRPEAAAVRSAQAQSQHNCAWGKPMLRPYGHLYGFVLDLLKPPRPRSFIVLFSTKSLFNHGAYPLIQRNRGTIIGVRFICLKNALP